MQIQAINTNTPNFQANRLRTASKLITDQKQPKSVIDIYSINKSDSDLINKLLMKIDLKDRSDLLAVKEKNNVNDAIRNILTKALNLTEKSSDGVYMAVSNNKYVTGLLDYTNGGIPLMKNLVVWRNANKGAARMNLFAQFLHDSQKAGKTDVVAYAEPKSKGGKWLLEHGFGIPDQNNFPRHRFVISKNDLKNNIKSTEKTIETNSNMQAAEKSENNIELNNLIL